jgi:6-linalyl-2-O,3-dimethylflaviolin/7-geranyloxy-5-hydroxy-2-methoxy-3-methylnaphthalene-1,4-dione synthase
MRWEPDARQLYNDVVRNISQPVKLIAAPPIRKAAERGAMERGRTVVTRTDLVDGIFDVVPQSFRARVVANLTSLGIDCSNYLNGSVRKFLAGTDLKQLWEMLMSVARHTGIAVDEVRTRAILEAYSQYYRKSPVSLRYVLNPAEGQALSVRYLETVGAHTPDPLTTAVIRGFVDENGSPMFALFEEMKLQCDVLGYGVDMDVMKGTKKFRAVLSPVPIDYLRILSRLPDSVTSTIKLLKSHGMNRIFMLGFDFEHQQLNLYVLIRNSRRLASDKLLAMMNDLQIPTPPTPLLEHCGHARAVVFSFSWQSDRVERICFTSLYAKDAPLPSIVPSTVVEKLKKAGFCRDKDAFLLGVLFDAAQHWFQLECDFEGALSRELLRGALAGV